MSEASPQLFTFTEQNAGSASGQTRVWYPKRVVLDRSTGKARATVLETAEFGEVFFLDGEVQSCEAELNHYHNLLVRPVLKMRERIANHMGLSQPWNCLVIGGGEGATARKLLENRRVGHVEMIDYDAELVRIFKEDLPHWSQGVYENPKLKFSAEDAWVALRKRHLEPKNVDCLLLDLTEPVAFGWEPWRELLELAVKRLTRFGVMGMYVSTLASDENGNPVLGEDDRRAFEMFRDVLWENEPTKWWQPFMYSTHMGSFGGHSLFFVAADAWVADWMYLRDPECPAWYAAKLDAQRLMNVRFI